MEEPEREVLNVPAPRTDREKTRATKCETRCAFAEVAKGEPATCSDVIHALETATFRELNPRYRLVPLTRLLSKGDAHCEFRHVLDAAGDA